MQTAHLKHYVYGIIIYTFYYIFTFTFCSNWVYKILARSYVYIPCISCINFYKKKKIKKTHTFSILMLLIHKISILMLLIHTFSILMLLIHTFYILMMSLLTNTHILDETMNRYIIYIYYIYTHSPYAEPYAEQ